MRKEKGDVDDKDDDKDDDDDNEKDPLFEDGLMKKDKGAFRADDEPIDAERVVTHHRHIELDETVSDIQNLGSRVLKNF